MAFILEKIAGEFGFALEKIGHTHVLIQIRIIHVL